MRILTGAALLACLLFSRESIAAEVNVREIVTGTWELVEDTYAFQSRMAAPSNTLALRFHENGILELDATVNGKTDRLRLTWRLTDAFALFIAEGLVGKTEFTPAFFENNSKMVLVFKPGEAWLLKKRR